MEVIPRKEAESKGFKRYFTDIPCMRGHVSERYVKSYSCCECEYDKAEKWAKNNPEKKKISRAKYKASDKGKVSQKKYRNSDKGRKAYKAAIKEWWQSDQGKIRSCLYTATRKAAKLQATPLWANQEAIKFFYECKPEGCHVDHIIPLQGGNVCGLHVENNLQWLSESENCSKGNKWTP